MEPRVTESKRYRSLFLALLVGALFAGGCGPTPAASSGPTSAFSPPPQVSRPEFGSATSIAMLNGSASLQVGDSESKAVDFVGKPQKWYEFRDAPPQFGPAFRARGWETESDGFGWITYDGQIVLAQWTRRKVDEALVQEAVGEYEQRLGKAQSTVVKASARYWFWEQGRHRLMICAASQSGQRYVISIAVGELNAMNGLRMAPGLAARDADRAAKQAETSGGQGQ